MAKNKIKSETFLDGLCSVWRLDDKQRPVPVIKNMRFQDRIIGTRRNYEAEQAGHKVERLIRIPRADQVERGAFVVISGKQYGIAQTQIIKDTLPECTDLTLEQPELLLDFDDTEVGGGGRF